MCISATPQTIIAFWYSPATKAAWFNSTPEIDTYIREHYQALWQDAAAGKLDHWQESAQGCLALCIILDQFPLNMFRGQAQSFSTEQAAVAIAKQAITRGFDKILIEQQQVTFLYMPLMHSECIEDQDIALRLFSATDLVDNTRFAKHHRDIIRRFGRFPHRNAILGRESSATELAYLHSKEAFTG